MPSMSDASILLQAIEQGSHVAADQLLPLVYDELRRLAAQRLAQETPGQTLDPTALVHEAYLRLIGDDPGQPWHGRRHFVAAAAEAMRRILIERARRKQRLRHGGGRKREPLEAVDPAAKEGGDNQLLEVDEALERLAKEDAEAAEVVKFRYFAGLTIEQTAAALGLSVRTVNRTWAYARAKLFQQLAQPPLPERKPGAIDP